MIGRWKMIDNLRRTLSAPATYLALLAGWTLAPAAAAIWTAFILAALALPAMLPFFTGLLPRRRGISKRSHARAVGADFANGASQFALLIILLAHQTWLMADAIVRTLYRLFVSHRRMLEWVTAAQAKLTTHQDLRGFYGGMAGGVALGAAAAVLTALAGHGAGLMAAPFVLLWILSPAVARWTSVPVQVAGFKPLSLADAASAQADRAAHMALLRNLRDGGR